MIQLRWEDKSARAKIAALMAAISGTGLAAMIRGQFGPHVATVTEARFASEGDEASGGWAPLAPATRRIRERQGYPPAHPINVRTGDLKRYVTKTTFDATAISANAVAMRYPASPATGELLNKMIIAQQGGVGQSGRPIPARPVLSFKASDAATILAMTRAHLEAVMRAG